MVLEMLTMNKQKEKTIPSKPQDLLNIVIVGDGGTGKTSLLMAFQGKKCSKDYTPTVFDTYTQEITVDGQVMELGLWDTAGQSGYDRLRPLTYPHCDAFIMCYSVDSPESLYNIAAKWLPEVEQFCPGVPKILAATKKDLRRRTLSIMDMLNSNTAAKFVSFEEGMCSAEKIGASTFLETSAHSSDSVRNLFEHTARIALHDKKKRDGRSMKKSKQSCCIL